MAKLQKPVLKNKQTEVKRIINSISEAVAQHKLKPGQKLVEAKIVDALKANRNHVQSAIQRLALQHIVTIEPNRGAFVSQPSAQEAKEIFAARRVVERGIVGAISKEVIEDNWTIICSHMENEKEITHTDNRKAIINCLSDYHKLLAEICGNKVLKEIFNNLMVRSSLIVSLYQRNDVPSCQHNEHQEIIDALKSGDTELAIKIMQEHLFHIESELVLDKTSHSEEDLLHALK